MLSTWLRKTAYALQKRILSILGDIKFFKYPCFLIYDPKSYRLKGKDFTEISGKVQKYDVLVRRFDAYLNTGFIPGFWNHAGIYMGHKGEMNGKVIHAVAEGVIEETLFDFCKSDHLMILRPGFEFNRSAVAERVYGALGKDYDFSFNFDCGDQLSCTELISFAFEDYDNGIKRRKSLFRDIIVADDLVRGNFHIIVEIRK